MTQLNEGASSETQAKWGFLKNIVNIDRFFSSGASASSSSGKTDAQRRADAAAKAKADADAEAAVKAKADAAAAKAKAKKDAAAAKAKADAAAAPRKPPGADALKAKLDKMSESDRAEYFRNARTREKKAWKKASKVPRKALLHLQAKHSQSSKWDVTWEDGRLWGGSGSHESMDSWKKKKDFWVQLDFPEGKPLEVSRLFL